MELLHELASGNSQRTPVCTDGDGGLLRVMLRTQGSGIGTAHLCAIHVPQVERAQSGQLCQERQVQGLEGLELIALQEQVLQGEKALEARDGCDAVAGEDKLPQVREARQAGHVGYAVTRQLQLPQVGAATQA